MSFGGGSQRCFPSFSLARAGQKNSSQTQIFFVLWVHHQTFDQSSLMIGWEQLMSHLLKRGFSLLVDKSRSVCLAFIQPSPHFQEYTFQYSDTCDGLLFNRIPKVLSLSARSLTTFWVKKVVKGKLTILSRASLTCSLQDMWDSFGALNKHYVGSLSIPERRNFCQHVEALHWEKKRERKKHEAAGKCSERRKTFQPLRDEISQHTARCGN